MDGWSRSRFRHRVVRRVDIRHHHSSHRQLLTIEAAALAPKRPVEAMIVPASRPVQWLREVMGLAGAIGSPLIALCSRRVSAREVADLGNELGVMAVAIDVTSTAEVSPPMTCDDFLADTFFERTSDVSRKRNLGLLLGRMAGYNRVLFVDDDVHGVSQSDARSACGLLDRFDAVGLENAGFPDNSVVCHVRREVGSRQGQFVGVGGLAVSPRRTRSFFPKIYNQDWFFLIGESQPPRVAMTGTMVQRKYDPFVDPDRARSEELGDCLAEGLYWLLDHHLPLDVADTGHWRDFLHRRIRFIDDLLGRLNHHFVGEALQKRLRALEVAKQTCSLIEPEFCVEYLDSWRADLVLWRQSINDLPTGLGIDRALEHLGLSSVAHRSGA